MRLVVNGDELAVPEGSTIADLVARMDIESRGVAIAVEAEVVSKSVWKEFELAEGQHVEIVRAVQGG